MELEKKNQKKTVVDEDLSSRSVLSLVSTAEKKKISKHITYKIMDDGRLI
jgi:hypothetical protein